MEFHRPTDINEALRLLAADPEARPLAGGASLVAMMNARLVEPTTLISLAGIATLAGITEIDGGILRIGAMTRHRETASDMRLSGGRLVLRRAAGRIANPVVRNMGTIGGSIALADPAADYPAALVCLDAEILAAGEKGERHIPAREFFTGWYETALEPGEMIAAVLIPKTPAGSVGVYRKLARVAGDFAIVSVALRLAAQNGHCTELQIAVGGSGPAPLRLPQFEEKLVGRPLDDLDAAALGRALAWISDPVDDVRASADYRRRVIPRMVEDAYRRAVAKLEARP
ncbi:MAG: xanthine dehydrogenase family protein subunit M [Dongiaceae bacterium]